MLKPLLLSQVKQGVLCLLKEGFGIYLHEYTRAVILEMAGS